MATWKASRLRILTLDTESRPLSYMGNDYTSAEITAVAWSWGKRIESRCLGEWELRSIVEEIAQQYAEADIVCGHYLKRHDLPRINAMLLELGLAPLGSKLVSDTYVDLKRREGVSASQESLAAMLGVRAPKVGMGQVAWRAANRLAPDGIVATRKRVEGDVRQHMAMRKELVRRGWLRPPRRWHP